MKLNQLFEEELPTFGKATATGSSISLRDVERKGYIKQYGTEEAHGEIREWYKVLKPFYLMKMGPKKVLQNKGDTIKGGWWDPT